MLTIFVKNFLLDETEIKLDFMIKGALKQSHLECMDFFAMPLSRAVWR